MLKLIGRLNFGGDQYVLAATAEERVRPEPFDSVEFLVAAFFDDVDDDS